MEIKKMLAFHDDPAIKQKYVDRVKMHQKLDQIAKGVYYENINGKIRACGVGCTIEGDDHQKYETELGIPIEIAYLEDIIFEGLPNGQAKKFPNQFLSAIKVGADLSKVIPKIVIWQFEDKKHGLKTIIEVADDTEGMDWCNEVVELYRRGMDETAPSSEYMALYEKTDRAGAGAGDGYDERMIVLRDEFLRLLKECK